MKSLKYYFMALMSASVLMFTACENDDDNGDDGNGNGDGVNAADTVAVNNLVAYFEFDGTPDDTKGHTVEANEVSYTTDRFGNTDAAYNGDVTSYIKVTPAADFKVADLSMSMWLRAQQMEGGTNFIVTLIDPNLGWNAGYGIWQEGSARGDTLRYKGFTRHQNSDIYGWIDTQFGDASNVYFPPSKWFHLALTYESESGERKIFYNGDEVATDTLMHSDAPMGDITVPDGATNFYIGQNPNASEPWIGNYEGDLDDLRIYNIALTEAQVAAIYSGESE